MKKTIHKANTRGHADHGWLQTWHTFSFADYYDPERIHFGALRVLNDDVIHPAMGFGTHPHDNMEIITIPLRGALEHKDSTGGHGVIKKNEIQVMSAGTGIRHSEYNASDKELLSLLQIWIHTRDEDIKPRYDQKEFRESDRKGHFQLIVSPDATSGSLMIHQDAWLYLGDFEEGQKVDYTLHPGKNGVYMFIIKGEILVAEACLKTRDGIGIQGANTITFNVNKDSEVLLMEVPVR